MHIYIYIYVTLGVGSWGSLERGDMDCTGVRDLIRKIILAKFPNPPLHWFYLGKPYIS